MEIKNGLQRIVLHGITMVLTNAQMEYILLLFLGKNKNVIQDHCLEGQLVKMTPSDGSLSEDGQCRLGHSVVTVNGQPTGSTGPMIIFANLY